MCADKTGKHWKVMITDASGRKGIADAEAEYRASKRPLYDLIVSRHFTTGPLKGMTIQQEIKRVPDAGRVGDSVVVKPFAGGHYVDTTLSISRST